ncbi:MAG: MFS transporter [Nocardioides sp.]|nr:MFS transporter [Nocardioides sp.]
MTQPQDLAAGSRDSLRRSAPVEGRWMLVGLLALTMVTGVVGSLGAPLVPGIAVREGVSLGAAQWSLTSTLLVGAVVTPVAGRVGSGRRRRPVMLGLIALVACGTLLAALPLGFGALVTGRALQGLGFAVTPLALALAREQLPEERSRPALAAISVANVASAGLGFPVAALVAHVAGVKGAFWAAFAVTLVALLVGARTVPASVGPVEGGVDWAGATLLGTSTLGLLLVISRGGHRGYTSPVVLGLLVVALVLMLVCVWWLLRTPRPLVDLRLACRPGVLGANLAALIAGAGMYLLLASAMVLVQGGQDRGYGLGHSVATAGLMLAPYALASVLGNRLALRLGPRIGPDLLLPLGCTLFGLGNLSLALWHGEVWHVVLAMVVGGLGSGATFNSIPWLMVRVVPAAETGSALSFNMVMRFLGFSMGSALSLALLQHFADASGRPTEDGFVAAALVGLGICLAAALTCLLLVRSATAATGAVRSA